MSRALLLAVVLGLAACHGSPSGPATSPESAPPALAESATGTTASGQAVSFPGAAQKLATRGRSTGACPSEWLGAPAVEASLAVPSGNEHVVLHAAATGSQNYACAPVKGDGGAGYAWSLAGPEATLSDCHSVAVGRHVASDAGATQPQWQTLDGAYVVAHKVAASTVDGNSVPWLLLTVDSHGGTGPLTEARYVQRVRTSGGLAPSAPCDASHIGALEKVPYTADYFFYAP